MGLGRFPIHKFEKEPGKKHLHISTGVRVTTGDSLPENIM